MRSSRNPSRSTRPWPRQIDRRHAYHRRGQGTHRGSDQTQLESRVRGHSQSAVRHGQLPDVFRRRQEGHARSGGGLERAVAAENQANLVAGQPGGRFSTCDRDARTCPMLPADCCFFAVESRCRIARAEARSRQRRAPSVAACRGRPGDLARSFVPRRPPAGLHTPGPAPGPVLEPRPKPAARNS